MKSSRKTTGGMRQTMRRSDKRLAWKGGEASHTTISEPGEKADRRKARGLGTLQKVKLRSDRVVQVMKSGKAHELEMITVVENKADRQFARNNIITKGAVLKAKEGPAEVFVKVTNRPGQHGMIQGIILDKFVKEKDLKAESGEKKEKKKKFIKKVENKLKEEPKPEKK